MEAYAMYFIDLILHLDKHLPEIMMAYGHLIYAILFMVVFCETGLVVTPFYQAIRCFSPAALLLLPHQKAWISKLSCPSF